MSVSPKIERGIPVPPAREPKYPLRAMKVGDSFFIPFTGFPNGDINVRKVAAYVARSIAGFRIVVRKQPKGWRVWRTS